MMDPATLLSRAAEFAPDELVSVAYEGILGRAPTEPERQRMEASLLRGESPAWLLGSLRYGHEGRLRAVPVRGLRKSYFAQRLFHIPVLGAVVEWLWALIRLPLTLRAIRALRQFDTRKRVDDEGRIGSIHAISEAAVVKIDHMRTEIDRALQAAQAALRAEIGTALQVAQAATRDEIGTAITAVRSEVAATIRAAEARVELELTAHRDEQAKSTHHLCTTLDRATRLFDDERQRALSAEHTFEEGLARAQASIATVTSDLGEARTRLDAILPPAIGDTLEIPGVPLIPIAREICGVAPSIALTSLTDAQRYALFESVFYDTRAVAVKQRVYLPYIDRDLARQFPFLDLGCGRGEFLKILAGEGIRAIGVDMNPTGFAALVNEHIHVVEADLLAFLEQDRGTYSGASLLQVAEHLERDALERVLRLLSRRLAPGAVFMLETPNPLSLHALSAFHTDPTHVAPLPPEAIRYAVELAGFEATRTLFQARIPREQFAGPDPRAYYADYAIIAWRGRA